MYERNLLPLIFEMANSPPYISPPAQRQRSYKSAEVKKVCVGSAKDKARLPVLEAEAIKSQEASCEQMKI